MELMPAVWLYFKRSDYWGENYIFRDVGEGGGSAGGVRNRGGGCEHVNLRGRLMRMQRVEFSIRHFPPSSFSATLCPRSSSGGVIPSQIRRWPEPLLQIWTILPRSGIVGALFTPGCSLSLLSPAGFARGVFPQWMLGPGCYLKKKKNAF